jgi:hypothetical protein
MPDEKKEKRVKIKIEEKIEEPNPKSEVNAEETPEVKPSKPPEDERVEEKTLEEKHEPVKEESHTEESTETKPESDKIPAWIIILAFFGGLALGAGLLGGIFYYKTSVENSLPEPTATPYEQPIVEETPESSPLASPKSSPNSTADLSKYSLQILNGSGISGEAGKVEDLLNKAGFTKTTTGNAKAYDYEETEVAIKASLPDSVFEEIKSALSSYKLKEVDPPSSSSSYDVVITVGKSKQ